jgi:two-component system, cell cycle sensor histidine kinase and response regulator CckA
VVESDIGKGTCFSIYLPQDAAALAAHRLTTKADSDDHPTTTKRRKNVRHGGSETILVVEDEASLRTVVKRILTNAGYDVLVAASADEAITIANETSSSIALVLSDVVMPGMSGSDLVERLTASFPCMKVIFTSGYTDEKLARFGVGDHHFLAKPFQAEQLTESIRGVLDAPKT